MLGMNTTKFACMCVCVSVSVGAQLSECRFIHTTRCMPVYVHSVRSTESHYEVCVCVRVCLCAQSGSFPSNSRLPSYQPSRVKIKNYILFFSRFVFMTASNTSKRACAHGKES